jgi:mRNA interferase MazF
VIFIGDIYSVEIYFEDNPSQSKLRPVLIIDIEDNVYLFAEITSVAPNNPPAYYDQFKIPINSWQQAGLLKPSFVKAHKLHKAEEDKFIIYRGKIEYPECTNILKKIIQLNI